MDQREANAFWLRGKILDVAQLLAADSPPDVAVRIELGNDPYSTWFVEVDGIGRIQFTPEAGGEFDPLPHEPGGQVAGESDARAAHHVEPAGRGHVLPQERLEADMPGIGKLLELQRCIDCKWRNVTCALCPEPDCTIGKLCGLLDEARGLGKYEDH